MKIRAVIIDDEKDARDTLSALIKYACPEVQLIATAGSIADGKVCLAENSPDLIFLDVEMPDGKGFEILENMNPVRAEVIFTTAHSQYALQALKLSAVDYLKKPINIRELLTAVNKAIGNISNKQVNSRLETLLTNFRVDKSEELRIVIPSTKGFRVALVVEIIRCEADGNYTHLFFKDGSKETASKTLKDFEELLGGGNFMRIHQSHLVNISHIKNYVKGTQSVIMCDNSEVDVARSKKDQFLTKFGIH